MFYPTLEHHPLDPEQVRQRIQNGLPGQAAHEAMARADRWIPRSSPEQARQAAVLILVYPHKDQQHIVFIERPVYENGHHSGQVSFPGGRFEAADASLQQTALREAWEEVNIDPEQVDILGGLTPLYIPVSNFQVHPFVGTSKTRPDFIPQAGEVQNILEIPLRTFLQTDILQTTSIKLDGGLLLRDVPYFNVDGQVIWGATSMILNELLWVMRD